MMDKGRVAELCFKTEHCSEFRKMSEETFRGRNMVRRIVVGISGASGALYGVRLLERLARREDVETHLVVSRAGEKTLHHETGLLLRDVREKADHSYSIEEVGAAIASGSFLTDGMVIAPCSVNTLSAIAYGMAANLLVRAADVTLKEGIHRSFRDAVPGVGAIYDDTDHAAGENPYFR